MLEGKETLLEGKGGFAVTVDKNQLVL